MPDATTIRQIELQLYKAEQGLGMPYDAERVAQLRRMLSEARKQKLSRALAAKRPPRAFFRRLVINYWQLAKISANPEIKQRMLDMAAEYQAMADENIAPLCSDAPCSERRPTRSRTRVRDR